MSENSGLQSSAAAPSTANAAPWRKEIHARVAGYRSRRGRRIEGAFSMRFPFPDQEAAQPVAEAEAVEEQLVAATEIDNAVVENATRAERVAAEPQQPDAADIVADPFPAPVVVSEVDAWQPYTLHPEPIVPPPPRPRPKRKVIAFPRPATGLVEAFHRLADPVLPEEPRILDVPEELEALPTTPFLDGLRFDADPAPGREADHVELPFRPASVAQRIGAAALDCGLVAVAAGLFAAVGYKMLPKLVLTKPVLVTAAMLLVLLWAVYQYMLVVYAGTTAGMRMAGVSLKNFEGKSPRPHQRRNRVLGLYLSTASLAMGLLWAFADTDALCWHDRMSRTYLMDLE
jgi:uncharacterized RDD family membrane protein YckC